MGAGHSLPEGEVQELLEATSFKEKELNEWYAKFIKKSPEGKLNKEQFNDLYNKIYISPSSNQEKTEHIFRSLDKDLNGSLCFKELMAAVSWSKRGTMSQKMKWLFTIYDVDGNGLITCDELISVVKSMHCASDKESVKKFSAPRMKAVFTSVDSDNDGYLSEKEFVEGVGNNPELIAILNVGQVLPLI